MGQSFQNGVELHFFLFMTQRSRLLEDWDVGGGALKVLCIHPHIFSVPAEFQFNFQSLVLVTNIVSNDLPLILLRLMGAF